MQSIRCKEVSTEQHLQCDDGDDSGDTSCLINRSRRHSLSRRNGHVYGRRLASLGELGTEVGESRRVTIHLSSPRAKLGKLSAGGIKAGPRKQLNDSALVSAVDHGVSSTGSCVSV